MVFSKCRNSSSVSTSKSIVLFIKIFKVFSKQKSLFKDRIKIILILRYQLSSDKIPSEVNVLKKWINRWEALIEKCTRCLNILLEVAAKRRRNYILDQTNVYPTAQKRKMAFFNGFQRKAVVIVPTDEEAKVRNEKRIKEEGKDVPDSAVMEMKANFKIPAVDDTFTEVEFPELQLEEALKVIEKYSTDAKAAGYGQPPTKKARQQPQHYAGNRNMRSNDRDSRHAGGRDSRSRDSRGSQSHRYSSSRSYRDSRDDRSRPLPPPSGGCRRRCRSCCGWPRARQDPLEAIA